jgi:hypothetical protein
MDNHTRAIGINRQKLLELITLGYSKIGFWYCLDIPRLSTNIHISFYRDGSTWANSEFNISNVWTYQEIDIAGFVTADMLKNDDSANFVVGFITQNYNDIYQNEPLTAYFSEIVALGREGDASEYLGTYSCGTDSIILAENGVATVNGTNCSYWVNNNYLVIDSGSYNYESYVIEGGYIYAPESEKFYQRSNYTVNVDANVKVNVANAFKALGDNGVQYSVFLVDNGVDDGVADTEVILSESGTYSINLIIGESSVSYSLKANRPTTTGNLATTLYSSNKVRCYLANNEQTGQVFHYDNNNYLYFNCFNSSLANAMIFDSDFVKECFDNGLTCIKVTYYCSSFDPNAWVRMTPSCYDESKDRFTAFTCSNGKPALKEGETVSLIWELSAADIQSLDFDNGFKLAISGLGAGAKKTQVVFKNFEFCAPNA